MDTLVWAGVALCILHSATFSGLNLALFGLSRLQLEVEAEGGNGDATRILALRQNSNFLLTTVLWGNVAVNVLLTQLTDSVLNGAAAFLFSTIGITFFGEIVPQAWFSRNALRMGSALAPVIRFYQLVLWPVARPSAWLLDRWLGPEGIHYMRQRDLKRVISKHMQADEADLEFQEGKGALNYLTLDDRPLCQEGELVDPLSIIALPVRVDLPVIPECAAERSDPFVRRVQSSGHKWVVLCDEAVEPRLVLDVDGFVRDLFLGEQPADPYQHCHRPIVIRDPQRPIGKVLRRLQVNPTGPGDDVIDHDVVLLWTPEEKRVMTGADLLGFLLRGIVEVGAPAATRPADPDPSS